MKILTMIGAVKDILRCKERETLVLAASCMPPLINMVSELAGESGQFRELAVHSKMYDSVIIMLYCAQIYNKRYLSAVVLDQGRILGVSDMTHRVSGEMLLDKGQSYRIYDSSQGKIGLIIGDDIFFPEVARTEVLSGARTLVHISPFKSDNSTRLALGATSLFNGVNTIYLLGDESGIVGLYGNVLERSSDFCGAYDIEPQHDDRLIRARRAEIYQDVFINDRT